MEWKTIDSAPKDGSMILLYLDGNVCQGLWHEGLVFGETGEPAPDSWVMGWNWERPLVTNSITHWMNLPEPPNETP